MPAQNKAAGTRTMENPESKISLPIAIYVGLGLVVLDLIDLIPFAGDFTNIVRIGINFYLYSIGVSGTIFLIGEGLKFIPIVQWLPVDLLAWAATVFFEWFAPAGAQKVVEKTGETVQGGAGGEAGAGAEAGGAAAAEGAEGAEAAGAEAEGAAGSATQEAEGSAGESAGESASAEEGQQGEGGEGGGGGEGEEEGENAEGGEEGEEGEENKDRELEEEMETGAERSPEEEAAEEDFDLQGEDFQSNSDEENDNEAVEEGTAHDRAVKSGKVIEMPSPRTGQAPEVPVPLPSIDEPPKPPRQKAA